MSHPTLRIRLTEEERKVIDAAAQVKSLDSSAWARSELLALAKKLLKRKAEDGNGEASPRPGGG